MTLRILHVYWTILGVFPFDFPEDGVIRFSYRGGLFSLILAVSYSACYLRAITGQTSFVLPRATPMAVIANLAGLSTEYTSLMWSWLFFGLRREKLRRILMGLKKINESFAECDMRAEDTKFLREVVVHLILVTMVWGLSCITGYLLLLHFEPWKLAMWMILNILRIVNHSVVLMFVSAMRLMRKRFRLLNRRIRYLPDEDAIWTAVRGKCGRRKSVDEPHEAFGTPDPLGIYGRIHADLVDLTTISVEFFSVSILFAILYDCIQMASGFYALCFVTKDRTWFLVPIGWALWVTVYLSELVIVVFVCDSTDKEANRTGNVLHSMLTKGCSNKYVDSAKVLSVRLLQKQLKIELFGLFRLQLGILHTIMSMLGVYITIMIQLDNQNVQKK